MNTVRPNFNQLNKEVQLYIADNAVDNICCYCNGEDCTGCFIKILTNEARKNSDKIDFNSKKQLQSIVDKISELSGVANSFVGEDNDSLTWDFDCLFTTYIKNNAGSGLYIYSDSIAEFSMNENFISCDDFIDVAVKIIKIAICKESVFKIFCDKINKDNITINSNVTLCRDSSNDKDLLCLDFVYDNSPELSVCDVQNIITLDYSEYYEEFLTEVATYLSNFCSVELNIA